MDMPRRKDQFSRCLEDMEYQHGWNHCHKEYSEAMLERLETILTTDKLRQAEYIFLLKQEIEESMKGE